jgi:hypothetical protein
MIRTFAAAAAAALFLTAPVAARAGGFLEGSVGQGYEYKPVSAAMPTNLMLTPGYQVASVLSLECGLVAAMGSVKNAKGSFDIQVRPMAELSAPLFPLYAKAIFSVNGLSQKPVKIGYGGALGWRLGLAGVGIFLEAGLLPTNVETTVLGVTRNELIWQVEGRAGVRFGG